MDILIFPDYSVWDGPVDWDAAWAAGVRVVGIKASEKNFVDKMFLINWAGAKRVGMLRFPYHYMNWTDPVNWGGSAQAKFFGDTIAFDPGELPPALDFEEHQDSTGKIDVIMPTNVLEHLQDALSDLQDRFRRRSMLYSGIGVWNAHMNSGSLKGSDPIWLAYLLWVANWVDNPDASYPAVPVPWKGLSVEEQWLFWQYTAKGVAANYGVGPTGEKEMDLSRFRGTLDDLKKFAAITPPVVVPPVVHPTTCPTCGQAWPQDVVNNYRVKADANLNVYFPSKDSRPSLGLLIHGTPVYIKDFAAVSWYAFFEPTPAFPKGGWIYKAYLEKIA
jgi:GH25 family lysozyme M1 (1,4-beta-N-acetylmuramidase)